MTASSGKRVGSKPYHAAAPEGAAFPRLSPPTSPIGAKMTVGDYRVHCRNCCYFNMI